MFHTTVYNFNAHKPILVILGRDVAERVCYQNGDLLSHLSQLMLLHYLGKHEHEPQKLSFQSCCIPVSKTTLLWLAISSTFINQF